MDTEGYRGIQVYTGLYRDTGIHGIQGVKRIQGETGGIQGYRRIQNDTSYTMGYRGIRGIQRDKVNTGGYRGIQVETEDSSFCLCKDLFSSKQAVFSFSHHANIAVFEPHLSNDSSLIQAMQWMVRT